MAMTDKASTQKEKSKEISPARERLPLNVSQAQRLTILRYAELPGHLAERVAGKGVGETAPQFTLDELDELLDRVEEAVWRAKGNEKQKVLRIVHKISELLGSEIDPKKLPKSRSPKKTAPVFQIKITLQHIDPPIWRRIQTKDCTLEQLHALIQVAMGWEFEHPYCFNIGGVEYEDMEHDDDVGDVCATKLSDVLPLQNRRPRFSYVYDFGDEWAHQLIVEERLSPEKGMKYPLCMAGGRACPPEDCGGPWSYFEFVEAICNPDHPRHGELLEWLGDEFDPEKLDLEAVNTELRGMHI